MDPKAISELFTLSSLVSFQGATIVVSLIPNVFKYLIGEKFTETQRRWTGFIVSIIIAYIIAFAASSTDFWKWIVAAFNAFLIFASAFGINEGLSAVTKKQPGVLGERKFFTTWID
jgi:hypothetical protein